MEDGTLHRLAGPYRYSANQEMLVHRLKGGPLHVWTQGVSQLWSQLWRPFAIALAGYLGCGPRLDGVPPSATADHLDEVDHLTTCSTGDQLFPALGISPFHTLCDLQEPLAHVYVNARDLDELAKPWAFCPARWRAPVDSPVLADWNSRPDWIVQ